MRGRGTRFGLRACAIAAIAAIATTAPTPATAAPSTRVDRVHVVGDSLTIGALPYHAGAFAAAGLPETQVSAHGSRGIWIKSANDPYTGIAAVDSLRLAFGDTDQWVVALGTNDALRFSPTDYPMLIRTLLDRIGSGRRILWVNVYLPYARESMDAWNSALEVAAAWRGDMAIFDWAALVEQNSDWLVYDGVHYTPEGSAARAAAIALAASSFFTPPRPPRTSSAL